MPENHPDSALESTASAPLPKKGVSPWKMILRMSFCVAVIFLVWLFYPVKPPAASLQRYLPQECFAVAENHAPQELLNGMVTEDVVGNFGRLPLWPVLRDEVQSLSGVSPDLPMKQLNQALQAASGQLFGARNLIAAAAGPCGLSPDGNPELAAILCVDNLGLTLTRLGLLAYSSGKQGDLRYLRLPQMEKNAPQLYLALSPQSRYVLITTSPALFSRFRFAQPGLEEPYESLLPPPPAKSPDAKSAAASTATTVLLRINLSPAIINAAAGGSLLPPGAHGLKADLWWNLHRFGGKGSLFLPGDFSASVPPRQGAFSVAPTARGLSISTLVPAQTLPAVFSSRPATQASPISGMMPEMDLSAALRDYPFLQTFVNRALLPHADGRGYFSLCAPENKLNLTAVWGVKNAAAARKDTVAAAAGALAEYSRREKDVMMQMLLSTLRFEPTDDGAVLKLPMLPAESTPYLSFGTSGAGDYAALRSGHAEGVLPQQQSLVESGLQTQTMLVWRHDPQLTAKLKNGVRDLSGLFGKPARGAGRDPLAALQTALAVLDSLEFLNFQQSALLQETGGERGLLLRWNVEGTLRVVR